MDLKAGTLLFLEPTHTERIERFRCKVAEVTDEGIFVDYPVNTLTKKTAFLVDGMQFRVTYSVDNLHSYAFYTDIIGRRVIGNIPMMILAKPDPTTIQKIQRREYVRVETQVDIALTVEGKHYQYVTEDISAGGVAIKLRHDLTTLKEGMKVQATIVLPFADGSISYVTTDANVVRIFEKEPMYLASVQFTDTDDLDKQHIVRFCFERQLAERKREVEF